MLKKLKDMKNVLGGDEEITAMDFRKSPGEVFDQVILGRRFFITRNGVRIATIEKYDERDDALVLVSKIRGRKYREGRL